MTPCNTAKAERAAGIVLSLVIIIPQSVIMITVDLSVIRITVEVKRKMVMARTAKDLRQEQIEKAAYELLQSHGFAGTSIMAIARRCKVSNETLYNWYGDKLGLFKALVARNSLEVKHVLEHQLADAKEPLPALQLVATKLIALVTSERAVALNRAAAADLTGELGALLSAGGRETVAPLLGQLLEQARAARLIDFDSSSSATELFINLVVGDLQIRRVTGAMAEPSPALCRKRAAQAIELLQNALR